ncbi:MAG: TonB-dependent receptor plug domain-containing protein [Cyclobacteriaceae bacterium]
MVGDDLRVSELSRLLYVGLISPKDEVIQELSLRVDSLGRAFGDFVLIDTLQSGVYKIRAFTNYQRNFEPEYFFSKTISVLSLDVAKVNSAKSDSSGFINFHLFPEGGDLQNGLDNFIAFKATDANNHPIEISGYIVDDLGQKIKPFQSAHDGMGLFILQVNPERTYTCEYEYKGRSYSHGLPNGLDHGYLLHVRNTEEQIHISVQSNNSSFHNTFLVLQSGDRIIEIVKPKSSPKAIYFSRFRENLPTGTIKVTMFDGNARAVAERLVFNENPLDCQNLQINVDSTQITRRSKINLYYELQNDGLVTSTIATLSTSISPIKHFKDPEVSIKSNLLLTSDLKGHVYQPDQYFDPKNNNSITELDLLMMTNGWRRFQWEKIMQKQHQPQYFPETGFTVSGRITKNINRDKGVSSKIYFSYLQNPMLQLTTTSDEEGYFTFRNLDVRDTVTAFVKTISENDRKKEKDVANNNTFIQLDKPTIPHYTPSFSCPDQLNKLDSAIIERSQKLFDIRSAFDQDVVILDAVEINDKKKPKDPFRRPAMMYSRPDRRIVLDSLDTYYQNVFEVIQSRFSGVKVVGPFGEQQVIIRGATSMGSNNNIGATFLVDGIPVDLSYVNSLPMSNVSFIDVLIGANAIVYGTQGARGVVAIYTGGNTKFNVETDPVGLETFAMTGYYPPREFYMPNYTTPSEKQNVRPDFRSPLYWNPMQVLIKGMGKDSFFTSDEKGEFVIYSEGITTDGKPFTGYKTFTVE